MKGITYCGECVYYSTKKHRCTRGATDDSDPKASFYADCPLYDVAPVVHGEWIYVNGNCGCSVCRKCLSYDGNGVIIDLGHLPYCPHCGARMHGELVGANSSRRVNDG